MSRFLILGSLVVVVVVAALVASAVLSPHSPLDAQVPCATAWACPDIGGTPDPYTHSSVKVYHKEQVNGASVKNTNELWKLTAKYRSTNDGETCACDDEVFVQQDAGAVSYNAGVYTYTPPGAPGFVAPFRSADICAKQDNCGDNPLWYKLHVKLDSSVTVECPGEGYRTYYLEQVLYTTVAVGNGVACNLPNVKVPLSQTFQTGDNGAFECDDTCPTGPSLEIQYR
jgi:hypothetical protein